MTDNERNFTFRIDRDDLEWLGKYAKNRSQSRAAVIRELIAQIRRGLHETKIDFTGYQKIPIGDNLVVAVPSKGVKEHLAKALQVVELLGVKK